MMYKKSIALVSLFMATVMQAAQPKVSQEQIMAAVTSSRPMVQAQAIIGALTDTVNTQQAQIAALKKERAQRHWKQVKAFVHNRGTNLYKVVCWAQYKQTIHNEYRKSFLEVHKKHNEEKAALEQKADRMVNEAISKLSQHITLDEEYIKRQIEYTNARCKQQWPRSYKASSSYDDPILRSMIIFGHAYDLYHAQSKTA